MAPRLSVLSAKAPRVKVDEIPLHEILSDHDWHSQFRQHVQDTMCPENLLFFVDVYMHRKNLMWDPFLYKIEHEPIDIRECASVNLPWIDEKMKHNPEIAPDSRRIYELYIKPLSKLEVNIPGKIRR